MLNYILQNEFKLYYCFKIRFFKTQIPQADSSKTMGKKSQQYL